MIKPDQSVVEKIKKLLALAEDNQNQHERELAMKFAMDLLAKHNLTTAEVQGETLKADLAELEGKFRLEPWVRMVLRAVCTLYYTDFYTTTRCNYWHVTPKEVPIFVGTSDNIAVALELASWLLNSIRLESNRLYKTAYERRSFRVGAADKLFDRAEEMVAAEKAGDGTTTGTSLMIIRNQLERANQEHLASLNLKWFRYRTTHVHPDAYDKGEEYGGKVALSRQATKATAAVPDRLPQFS